MKARERDYWDAQVLGLIRELGPRVRGVMVGILLVLGLLLCLPMEAWRFGSLLALISLGMGVMVPVVLRLSRSSLEVGVFRKLLVAGVFLHGGLIALSGGLDSPLFPVFIIVPVLAGGFYRDWRGAAAFPLLASLCIVAIAGLQWSGLLPSLTALSPAAPHLAGILSKCLLMIFLCWVSMMLCATFVAHFERAAQRLTRAQAELLEAHRERHLALDALSQRLAHELKNPLSSIKGLTQLLQRRGDPTGHLQVISGEVERLREILDSFLEFSHQEPRFDDVDLCALVEEVLLVLEARLLSLEIQVQRETWPPGCRAKLDASQIKQVLFNLFLNALEAMEHEPGERILRLRLRREDEGICLQLGDTGSGLKSPPEELLKPLVTTKASGSGLGLSISHGILRGHGGELKLRPEPKGATAEIWIPQPPVNPYLSLP